MKNSSVLSFRIAAAIALLTLVTAAATPVAMAIPNSVGGFFSPANMPLENFVNRAAMWQPDVELKGDWEAWSDPSIDDATVKVLRLKESAVVFGINAKSVTLQLRDNQALRVEISYSTADEARSGQTFEQLIANINAWSGATISSEQPRLDHEQISIAIDEPSPGILRVVMTPVASTTS